MIEHAPRVVTVSGDSRRHLCYGNGDQRGKERRYNGSELSIVGVAVEAAFYGDYM